MAAVVTMIDPAVEWLGQAGILRVEAIGQPQDAATVEVGRFGDDLFLQCPRGDHDLECRTRGKLARDTVIHQGRSRFSWSACKASVEMPPVNSLLS
jgi:hypothetical protein